MDAIAEWTGLLRPDHELTPDFCRRSPTRCAIAS